MAFSKADIFNSTDYQNSLVCKALSHPARIAIIRFLSENGQATPSLVAKDMPLSQAAVAQHFKILRQSQLIDFTSNHPNVIYWLNEELTKTQLNLIKAALSIES